ncbi:glycosyltransferase family 4 protein [Corynebacterium casei]|uniref:glycosyltransferase family 4 protein n=1 Tax=Corynebacterium casei TaxID=160386 RepID=UPI003FD613B0
MLSQNWFPENGVPQRRWQWLVSGLIEDGHDVGVVAPPPQIDRNMGLKAWARQLSNIRRRGIENGLNGETIWRSGYIPAGRSLTSRVVNQASVALGQLVRIIGVRSSVKKFAPDLIVGTVPALPTAFVTYLSAKFLRCGYWIDLRDAWPELLNYSNQWNDAVGPPSVRERILRLGPAQILVSLTGLMLNKVLVNSQAIVVTSERLKKHLEAQFNFGNSRKDVQVEVVRNVFPRDSIAVFSEDSSAEQSVPTRTLRVLYAGTIGRAQDLQNAFRAAELVFSSGIEIQFKFIGSGPAMQNLEWAFAASSIDAEFLAKKGAYELLEFYEWADTALVHLANWEPLQRAVPSKTYELMEMGLHITGVVSGETADLIQGLNAGSVVPPSRPEDLAKLWIELASNPERLKVDDTARNWVLEERNLNTPDTLARLIKAVEV